MVDIPVELFMGFIGASVAMAIFGLIRQPQIPAMVAFAGIFIFVMSIMITNITLGQIIDTSIISEQISTNSTVYHYVVESGNTNATTANSAGMNFGQAENPAVASSILVGKSVQCIDLQLAKVGNPNFPIFVGTFVSDTPLQSFGTMSSSSLTTTLTFYSFCVSEGSEAVINSGNRIGFTVTGGNSTNYVLTRYQTGNPIDGTNTLRNFLPFGTTSWSNSGTSAQDMVMRIYDFELTNELTESNTYINDSYEFTELPKTMFALFGSILILAGALMVYKE